MRYILLPIYRVWFYILMGIPIILLFPILIILTISEKTYHLFFMVARFWAAIILYGMGFWPIIKRVEPMEKGQSYMLVANHTSMTDIMMMLLISKNPFVFVGKKELAKIPVFGFFYKRTCILVDRNNPRSRKEVFDRARKRMQDGVGICIFPEGGIPEEDDIVMLPFKDGAFRLAIEHQIPLLPITLLDNRKRFPFEFFRGSPGKMRAQTHKAIDTVGMELSRDKARFRESVKNTILNSLEKY
ncbi:MAG: lysophospholipid acyltransferase family protein [Nonlabens sp.]|uniref:lysophospholipid acyltransferase family protein n=1 Tax=Nonlabens sp. TaxID=1888209 RepID=UPI00321A6762